MRRKLPGKTTGPDLARVIHEVLDLPMDPVKSYPVQGAKIVAAIIQVLKEALLRGEDIYIKGFGKFKVHRAARPYHIKKPFIYNTPGQYSPEGSVQSDTPEVFQGKKKVIFSPSLQLTAMLNADNPNAHERKRAMSLW